MKYVPCYLCSSDQKIHIMNQSGDDPYLALVSEEVDAETLGWFTCRICGLVYRTPRLDDEETGLLYERYESNVFADESPDEYFDRIINLPVEDSENVQKGLWLREVLLNEGNLFGAEPSVLDVGCGGGTFLHTLRRILGTEAIWGVELNPAYAELAARRLGRPIVNARYRSGTFGRKFDLIVNTKVLEHVLDPIPFLGEIERDLTAEGVLFLEVPDVSDFLRLDAEDARFFVPHVYFYSVNTLKAVLARAGLRVHIHRVVVTKRGRSYLQVLARKTGNITTGTLPYDDAGTFAVSVRHHFLDRLEDDNR